MVNCPMLDIRDGRRWVDATLLLLYACDAERGVASLPSAHDNIYQALPVSPSSHFFHICRESLGTRGLYHTCVLYHTTVSDACTVRVKKKLTKVPVRYSNGTVPVRYFNGTKQYFISTSKVLQRYL